MSLSVETPGLLSTIQDLGRSGYQHLGVGPGGALDEVSHRIANRIVGNPASSSTLEMTLSGPTLRFDDDTLIALCGGDLSATIGDQPLPTWRPVFIRAGVCLRFGKAVQGARAYLAVGGGFQIPPVMGSVSTHLAGHFGGFQGRPLRKGDRLDLGPGPEGLYPSLRRRFQGGTAPFLGSDWFSSAARELDFTRPATLGLIPGPQWAMMTTTSREALLASTFRVGSQSSRMALHVEGATLALDTELEMISSGVATGTLQLPPDGRPLLLLADRQTTGGYPRLGELASVDLPVAAQLRPGEALRFERTDVESAQRLLLQRKARLRDLEKILSDQQAL